MISLELALKQDDCPLGAASSAEEVAFVTPHWHYHHDRSTLELRVLVDGESPQALERALETVDGHPSTETFSLLAKEGATARAKLSLTTTDAMGTVLAHDGYLTGPFRNVDGIERWEIGFDTDAGAEGALATLERTHDECRVTRRHRVTPASALEEVRVETLGSAVLEAWRSLTPAERETVERAIDGGYYEVPRVSTLGDLATHRGVSDAAVSKTLRRGEAKLLSSVLEGQDGG